MSKTKILFFASNPQDTTQLSERLLGTYRIDNLLIDLKDVPNREERLRDMAKAAAYFEVAADSLLAS